MIEFTPFLIKLDIATVLFLGAMLWGIDAFVYKDKKRMLKSVPPCLFYATLITAFMHIAYFSNWV